MDFVTFVLVLISVPASYFLTLAMLGVMIESAGSIKICVSVAVALVVFSAIVH